MPGMTNSSARRAAWRFWRSVSAAAFMDCRIPFASLGLGGASSAERKAQESVRNRIGKVCL